MAQLTDPLKIGAFTLKNRITMAPTVKFDYTDASGVVSDKLAEHYTARAEGGFGLICVEATAVTPDGRFGPIHMGLWDDSQIEGHRRITEACHKNGAVAMIQLNHTGYTTHPSMGPAIGPSAVKRRTFTGEEYTTVAMTTDDIHRMQKAYVDAALRARAAGYDGVQLHGCHGYLINQFVAPSQNFRDDIYGGDAEGRARFATEIIADIRRLCGPDFLISVRTTGCDSTVGDAISVAECYVAAGCDYLQVSTGMSSLDDIPAYRDPMVKDVRSLGALFRDHFAGRVPVSCVGGIKTPEEVHYLIEHDCVDTVDIGRAALAFPGFAAAVIDGTPYKRCYGCKACQYGPGTAHRCPNGFI